MNTYQVFKSGPKKGQPKTLTDRVVRFLVEGLKMREVSSRSKYRQFAKTCYSGSKPPMTHNYFVGKAGAVRAGNSVTDSVSLTDQVHANMKIWERRLQATVDKCNQILAKAEGEANINNLDRVIH
jgi:hypothetical protein